MEVSYICEGLRELAVPIDSLNPDPENARLHPEENIAAIMASLAAFGQDQPVVASLPGRVIRKGNGRWEAAKRLNWEYIAAIIVEEPLLRAAARAVADNRTGESSRWDESKLGKILQAIRLSDEVPLSAVGFNETEVGRLVQFFADPNGTPKSKPHVAHNSGDNEWYTPAEYADAARAVMGGIDLDPASTLEANTSVRAEKFYTEADDGLAQPWGDSQTKIWMNPPYAQPLCGEFCAKLVEEYVQCLVSEACVLVNNATETGWFQDVAGKAAAICFPRGRVKFWHPSKEATPLQGQAVLYLGGSAAKFASEFGRFGLVVRSTDANGLDTRHSRRAGGGPADRHDHLGRRAAARRRRRGVDPGRPHLRARARQAHADHVGARRAVPARAALLLPERLLPGHVAEGDGRGRRGEVVLAASEIRAVG